MRERHFLALNTDGMIGAALAAGPAIGGDAQGPATVVAGWNRLALASMRVARPGTPTAARLLALLHTAMYNAWAAYDDQARQTAHGMAVRLPRAERDAASKGAAISHAAHLALTQTLPTRRAAFDAHLASLGLDPASLPMPLTPAGIGRSQAAAVLGWWRKDGAAIPFAARAGAASLLLPAPHPATAAPAGDWCRVAAKVVQRERYGDDEAVRLFFALAHALADAELAGVAGRHGCSAAAAEVLRRFTGSDRAGLREMARAGKPQEAVPGREIGGMVFDKARRYWRGVL